MKWNAVYGLISTQRARLGTLAVLLSSNLFTAGVGFLTTITIANTLGAARFGELAYAYAIGGIIAVNVRFGMDRSLIRDLTHSPERFGDLVAASVFLRTLFLLLILAGFLVLRMTAIDAVQLSLGALFVVLATMLLPLQIANVFDVWESQGRHAVYFLVQRCVYFLIVWAVLLFAADRFSILWIGSALLISTLLFLFLQYRHAWKRVSDSIRELSPAGVCRTSLELMRNNLWLWLASVAALGLTALNSVVLKHVSGASDLGIYAASWQLVSLATLLLKNVSRIGRPIMARRTRKHAVAADGNLRFIVHYSFVMLAAVGAIALPLIVCPHLILRTLFTPEYAGGDWVLRVFGVYLLVRAIETVFSQHVVLSGMDRAYFAASILAGSVSMGCCAMLIPRYSATGAALSVLIGTTAGTLLSMTASMRHVKELRQRGKTGVLALDVLPAAHHEGGPSHGNRSWPERSTSTFTAISVIIPACNAAPYLKRCIDSALTQTFQAVEILVVDDGSTDETAEIVAGYGDKVRYVRQDNAGVSAARNAGIRLARGEWIALLDADDQWRPHHLANAVAVLQKHPDLKWYGAPSNQYLQETGQVLLNLERKSRHILPDADYFDDYMVAFPPRAWFATATMVIHNSVFKHVGLFDPERRVGEDLDMWFRIGLKYPKVGYGPEVACNKYERGDSLSRSRISNPGKALQRYMEAEKLALGIGPDARRRAEPRIMYWVTKLLKASINRSDCQAVRAVLAEYDKRLAPRWRWLARGFLVAPWAFKPVFAVINAVSPKQRALRAHGLQ
jgi:O-antigen/teichoic acid export membrane protein/glycosyltransferase involved in cell wall biosynthesis